jgi:hypothetical protein
LFFSVTVTYKQSWGFAFVALNGPALMQRATRSSSFPSCQALKKSACMVEYTPEESFTLPRVVGMGNWKFVWSLGTGYGWLGGHPADPASTMCMRWSALSTTGCPLESTARQSGKKMRTTNLPLEHCVGGVVDHVPFWHLHSTFLPCTVTIFSPAGWGVTSMAGSFRPTR